MLIYLHILHAVTAERKSENDVTTDRCSQLKNRLKSMAAVKCEFSIGALKAFYSIFCPDIFLAYISRNAVSENKKNRPPKFHRSSPLKIQLKEISFASKKIIENENVNVDMSILFDEENAGSLNQKIAQALV